MSLSLVVASAVVGLLVGLTGTGSGALLTPLLIGWFAVGPVTAVATDLVASAVLRPLAVITYGRRGAVDWGVARRVALGAMPGALLGSLLPASALLAGGRLPRVIGVVLLAGGAALLARAAGALRRRRPRTPPTWLTVGVGLVGGVAVGATSVGAGALMIAVLALTHPSLEGRRLVGTDLAQSVPLAAAAAAGALGGSSVSGPLLVAILAGALPGALVGSRLANGPLERVARILVVAPTTAAGLVLVGVPAIVGIVAGLAAAGAAAALSTRSGRGRRRDAASPARRRRATPGTSPREAPGEPPSRSPAASGPGGRSRSPAGSGARRRSRRTLDDR